MPKQHRETERATCIQYALQGATDKNKGKAISKALSAITGERYESVIQHVDYSAFHSGSPIKRPVRIRFEVRAAAAGEKATQDGIDALSAIDDLTIAETIATGIATLIGMPLEGFIQRRTYVRRNLNTAYADVTVLLGCVDVRCGAGRYTDIKSKTSPNECGGNLSFDVS